MARYLVRLSNDGHKSRETGAFAKKVRRLLGAKNSIGHLRISSRAIEFDLFADNSEDLEAKKAALERNVSKILTLKPLDLLPRPKEKLDVLTDGISLFNEERFWECHEVLEQIWHPSKGEERNTIQGLILTAAALVHHQRGEEEVCLSMLNRARKRLGSEQEYLGVNLSRIRQEIDRMLESKEPRPFSIDLTHS